MTVNQIHYKDLKTGDVIRDWDTEFRVQHVSSFVRHGARVWLVSVTATSTPHRVLNPFVTAVGDEWALQAAEWSGACWTELVARVAIGERLSTVGSSVGASGVYRSAHVRVINGTMYAFHHEVYPSGRGRIEVFRDDEAMPCRVFTGKVRKLPGLMNVSKMLGKLISF